jgi:lysozyme
MAFNLGGSKFRKFKKMFAAIKKQDFDLASQEILDSKYAKQVGARANELAEIMQRGY